ncbi:hypothetical protein LCGC14_1066310 [marine sediment metagenome]|uniref:Uncharacterized protein n=1 Tax=marine sediment metagenome TaxID=412755 RepID=A0A0F9N6N4_9ZZZZ
MPITLTPQEKALLKQEDSLIQPLDGADGAESAAYHNPKTGQEFPNLPMDPRALTRYLRRGLMLGPASPELKAKWLAASAERAAADDAMVAEYEDSDQAQIDQGSQDERFKDAVAAAVAQVLEKLRVDPTAGAEKVAPTLAPEEEFAPAQLELFKAVDAPTETGNKQVVPEASRPELHLVE